jgi:serine/threonine protein kinase
MLDGAFSSRRAAIARLKHPNVVTVYRFGESRGRPYLVSEYVAGQSLARVIKPVPWQRALAIGAELARGLAAAHEQGVLHRDIKPAKVEFVARHGGGSLRRRGCVGNTKARCS